MAPIDPQYEDQGTPDQIARGTRSIVAAWGRRLLRLAGANEDMPQDAISTRFDKMAEVMRFAEDMQEKRNRIENVLRRDVVFDTLKIEDLLEWIAAYKKDSENRKKKVMGGLWAVALVIIGGLVTVLGSLLTAGKHP